MAAVDYFLHIDGIRGESHDAAHRGAIDLLSWHWAAENTGTMRFGGGGAGRARVDDFHFTMRVSAATPKLVQKLDCGEHIPKAVLVCRKAGKTPCDYLHITFEDSVVDTYTTGSAEQSGETMPREGIQLELRARDVRVPRATRRRHARRQRRSHARHEAERNKIGAAMSRNEKSIGQAAKSRQQEPYGPYLPKQKQPPEPLVLIMQPGDDFYRIARDYFLQPRQLRRVNMHLCDPQD